LLHSPVAVVGDVGLREMEVEERVKPRMEIVLHQELAVTLFWLDFSPKTREKMAST
jgi:hypothetical protein